MSETAAAREDGEPDEPHAEGEAARWPGSASTPSSATGPADYALINLTFLAGLAGVAALAQRRLRDDGEVVGLKELPMFGVAAFALADVLAKQKIMTWLREPFVEESAEHRPVGPEGTGLQFALGELLTCTRCVGAWSALGLVGLRVAAPAAGRTVAGVLTAAGINHFLQASFSVVSDLADVVASKANPALS